MDDSDIVVETDEPAEDSRETLEDRVSRLEYVVSRVRPEHFAPRAPFTNPIDDPDDPPFDGTWDDHPWHGVEA